MSNEPELLSNSPKISYPADHLMAELRKVAGAAGAADDSDESGADPIGDQLLYLLDSELFEATLTEEVDHLLSDSERLTSGLNQALMRGADQALTERRGARSDLGDLRAEIQERLETIRKLDLDNASPDAVKLAKLEALVKQMEDGPVSFGELEPADLAYWIVRFAIRADLLLSAVDPQHVEAAEAREAGPGISSEPLLLKAENEPWRVFKKHVRELVDASSAQDADLLEK